MVDSTVRSSSCISWLHWLLPALLQFLHHFLLPVSFRVLAKLFQNNYCKSRRDMRDLFIEKKWTFQTHSQPIPAAPTVWRGNGCLSMPRCLGIQNRCFVNILCEFPQYVLHDGAVSAMQWCFGERLIHFPQQADAQERVIESASIHLRREVCKSCLCISIQGYQVQFTLAKAISLAQAISLPGMLWVCVHPSSEAWLSFTSSM